MSGRELGAWIVGAAVVVAILAVRGWRDADFVGRVYLAVLLFVAGLFVGGMLIRC